MAVLKGFLALLLLFLMHHTMTLAVTFDMDRLDQPPVNHMLPGDEQPIPGEYLIRIKSGMLTTAAEKDTVASKLEAVKGLQVKNFLKIGDVQLFSVRADSIDDVSKITEVAYVEPNMVVRAFCAEEDMPYMWGLDRIDQISPLSYDYSSMGAATYIHGGSVAGKGVDVYVLDSGINIRNSQFESRAIHGYTASDIEDGDDDLNGHGTHVAGTIGANYYGVAKQTNLIAVKVLNGKGTGSTAAIIEGMEWVMDTHQSKKLQTGKSPKSVVNMSLGGSRSQTENDVVQEMVSQGITVVVSAGNDDINACYTSPASAADAITVGSVGIDDWTSDFTNWGECVDIFAPGEYILSINASSDEPAVMQGTSQASPHVAGVIAMHMGFVNDAPDPASIKEWLLREATENRVQFRNDSHALSPDRLLYVDCDPYSGSFIKQPDLLIMITMMMFTGFLLNGENP